MDEKQLSLLDDHEQADNGPVVCLGMTFNNDEERREYFRNELRKKLPELKKIEGFPIGDDEDIIALSDPPYYTACPNPWINDFIEEWEREKKEKYGRDENEEYHREPFAADVSEGKLDPVYKAHSYHTKVPHKAIMRFILHYTKPGDIIFDAFAGTGMTGVAAQECGNRAAVESLGYVIDDENNIFDAEGNFVSKLGARRVILNDLSPAASFISMNYNSKIDIRRFEEVVNKLINDIESEYGWMYETIHVVDGIQQRDSFGDLQKGKINYTVWSDVFVCPECGSEMVFWDVAINKESKKILDKFHCPNCQVELNKKTLEKAFEYKYDELVRDVVKVPKEVPVLIQYKVGNNTFEKKPDAYDLEILEKIDSMEYPCWVPSNLIMGIGEKWGDTWRAGYHAGITHVHHFYTKRNMLILGKWLELSQKVDESVKNRLLMTLTGVVLGESKLNRYLLKDTSFPFYLLSGTLYIASQRQENYPLKDLKNKALLRLTKIGTQEGIYVQSTQSSTSLFSIPDNSIDYLFFDPPFGSNLMYSELNFITESWLKVITNNKLEAIENKSQGKDINHYKELMTQVFKEAYRVLKKGRWMTVEFSNSQASVWNAIQEALQKAGFIIANVSALDKKQGTFKAITTTTAVKQDLVISAYKPSENLLKKLNLNISTEETAWFFVEEHLSKLPIFLGTKGEAQIIAERTPRILFDRMVAYHVQNGLPVPISSAEFQAKVAQRFPMRDGMVFLESQVAEYDKKRTLVKEFVQMSLFVTDETSAIEWLRQQLLKKPQTRQDLHPNFMKEIQHIAKHEKLPELDDLLEQNFLKYEGDGPVPDQIASYLRRNYKDLRGLENDDPQLKEKAMNRWYVPDPNKQADLEKLREKALLREFEGYVEELSKSKKKLKQFRTEAIRAGFKKAWSEKDYETIVKVGERLPESVIQEDDKLLMYYDNAQIRLGM
ncbi:putative methyltransferase [Geobacillus sp. 12AMOR1]|nr:putative methyltransferase [Geobacillus sp. 12AMOR1]